jgi:hypothetical protein
MRSWLKLKDKTADTSRATQGFALDPRKRQRQQLKGQKTKRTKGYT